MQTFMRCKRCGFIYGCHTKCGKGVTESTRTCRRCDGCNLSHSAYVNEEGYCNECLWEIIMRKWPAFWG
jgi:hypothetical protein